MTDKLKRKAIPDKIKLEVFRRQRGRCALTGKRLKSIYDCEFDHFPALKNRPVAASGRDYDPPQLSMDHLQAVCPEAHKAKTAGDVGQIAKSNRIRKGLGEHAEKMQKAGKAALPPRQLYEKESKRK